MKVSFHSSVVFTQDMQRMKRFYTEVLKQEIELDFGKNVVFKNGFSIWQMSPDHEIYQSNKTKPANGKKRFELYFETDNMLDVVKILKENEVEFLHDLVEESWGQQTIRFYDPEENIVEIGERLQTFIIRMHRSGLSVDQIHDKSSVPQETIKQILKAG